MADEIPMVSSCPLCLASDEAESMVTVEIERAIIKSRAAILICRNCVASVIDAVDRLEPPLLHDLLKVCRLEASLKQASEPSAPDDTTNVAPEGIDPMREMGFTEVFPCPADCELDRAGVPHFHTSPAKEEPSDG